MESIQQRKSNPLVSLMRQPKIYIKLPSQGKFWPQGSLNKTVNDEYPVYSMTAKDELVLKTPDALMNGQAVVDVIHSCMPNIVNAWQTPSIDVDTILIAIRLATYGESMDMTYNIAGEELNYNIDLRTVLDQISSTATWDERIEIGTEMVIFVRPVNYELMSKASIQAFESQKIINLVNDTTMSEEQKVDVFKESFKKLTEITIGIINQSVYKIESVVGTTEDPQDIQEFMENSDKYIFDAVKKRLDKMKLLNTTRPMKIATSAELQEKGYPTEIEAPITFDPSSFFV